MVTADDATYAQNPKSSMTDCHVCPAGEVCPGFKYVKATSTDKIPCARGYFCPPGTKYSHEFPCPAGTKGTTDSLTAASECTPCAVGTGCPAGTDSLLVPACEAGYYCPVSSTSTRAVLCPGGTYRVEPGAESDTDCSTTPAGEDCPVGSFCPPGSTWPAGKCSKGYECPLKTSYPVICPKGKYMDELGQGACKVCGEKHYCDELGMITYKVCPDGLYNNVTNSVLTSLTACLTCPSGSVCTGGGIAEAPANTFTPDMATATVNCPAGYICPANTTSADALSNKCPELDYCEEGAAVKDCPDGCTCPEGTKEKLPCPPGQKKGATKGTCENVPEDYYLESVTTGDLTEKICPAGHKCEAGSYNPEPCPEGTYQPSEGQHVCITCEAGFYCPGGAEKEKCRLGYFCDGAAVLPQKCPIGTYGAAIGLGAESECADCPEGYYCAQKGLKSPDGPCAPGFLCKGKAKTPTPTVLATDGGEVCPAGGYCEAGATAKADCIPGTYNPAVRGRNMYDCLPCPGGKYCEGSSHTPDGDCTAGYYCPIGSYLTKQNSVNPGHYAAAIAAEQTKCPAGTFNNEYNRASCVAGPAGFLVLGLGNTGTFIDCPRGSYCEGGTTATTATKCSKGYYSPELNAISIDTCRDCPPERYCSFDGLSVPGDGSGSAELDFDLCDAGFYCAKKAISQRPGAESIPVGMYGPCYAGHYCPQGSSFPLPCPSGTFHKVVSDTLKAKTECTACPAGKYCPIKAMLSSNIDGTDEYPCGEGYFCDSGSHTPRKEICTPGNYCPTGSSAESKCPIGEYQYAYGQSACLKCPAGFYCKDEGMTTYAATPCPKGHYCPIGTKIADQFKCPIGTFNPLEAASSSTFCILCPPGYWCGALGLEDYKGLADADLCVQGYYCPEGSKSGDNFKNKCPKGYYCPAGSSRPISCPGGKYCASEMLHTNQGDCVNGYYCKWNAITATPTNLGVDGGDECSPGYYCPAGISFMIPCPPGTYNPSKLKASPTDCLRCDDGSYCSANAATTVTGECSAGFYCDATVYFPLGTAAGGPGFADEGRGFTVPNPADRLCPIGHKCPTGSPATTACVDEYQDEIGQSVCKLCPAGYKCTTEKKELCLNSLADISDSISVYCLSGDMAATNCPAGTYTYKNGASIDTDCITCPPGHYCPNTGSAGKVIPCVSGNYCLAGATSTTDPVNYKTCPKSHFCPIGSITPIPCPYGRFCDTTGLTESILTDPNYECDAGYLCKEGSETKTPIGSSAGGPCKAGYYCLKGTTNPTPCGIGKYRQTTGGEAEGDCTTCTDGKYCTRKGLQYPITPCDAGYYCPDGQEPVLCPAGARCESGSKTFEPCPNKMYQPEPGHASCVTCPAGYYCALVDGNTDTQNAAVARYPIICSKGNYCPSNSDKEYKCPAGTFNPRMGGISVSDCEDCTPGKYCAIAGLEAVTGSCTAGWYCTSKAKTATPSDNTGAQCPTGHYCEAGTYLPMKCPIGKYSDSLKATSDATCLDCQDGHYCPLRAGTSRTLKFGTNSHKCDEGYLCTGATKIPNPAAAKCIAGTYCIKGATIAEACDVGTYNPWPGQSTCLECPPGRVCNSNGLSTAANCPVGFYCPLGTTSSTGKGCEAGTYNPIEGAESQDECLPCPPGQYCVGGKENPDGDCTEGYVCTGSSSSATPTNVFSFSTGSNGQCPPGYTCQTACTGPIPCPLGQYQDTAGQTACIYCKTGKVCDKLGISTPTELCAEGHFCLKGARFNRPLLNITDYGGGGETINDGGSLCPAGFYCPPGITAPVPCPDGYYEPRTGSAGCQVCPQGYLCKYKSAGTETPTICPIRQYCTQQSSAGIDCPDGTWTDQTGLEKASQCKYCPPGHFCKEGDWRDSADWTTPNLCKAGYYCDQGGKRLEDVSKLCPIGHYCLVGSLYPTPCPRGKINMNPGIATLAGCVACDEGYYCVPGEIVKKECPKGYYCEIGSDMPTKCGKFKWNGNKKSGAITDCIDCAAGYYCDDEAIRDETRFPCKVGHYCLQTTNPASPTPPTQCAAGSYRNTVGAAAQTDCVECPAGYYCPLGNVQPIPCEASYYCPLGSGNMTECEEGHYCPAIAFEMTDCPAAYYCEALAGVPTKCANGYYCGAKCVTPEKCPLGTMGTNIFYNINETVSCRVCEPGFYANSSNPEDVVCDLCTAGYICTGGCTEEFPETDADGGYVCPIGAYCPKGSYGPTPCPAGTYGTATKLTSSDECTKCTDDMFQNLPGQTRCQSCGTTSKTADTGDTCVCIGQHRTFQMNDKTCLCKPMYEPVDSADESDSDQDCQPLIFDRCTAEGDLRDAGGKCVGQDHCPNCPNGKGTRAPDVGICQCDEVDTVNAFCNQDCRNKRKKAKVDFNGIVTVTDPVTGVSNTYTVNTLPGFFGTCGCYTENANCKLVNSDVTSTGFTADYQPPSIVGGGRRQMSAVTGRHKLYLSNKNSSEIDMDTDKELRSLATTTAIRNPLFCLDLGDTMMFGISDTTHYPVYLKDSLINSNENFDYSLFRDLATAINNGTSISTFSFTFSQAGIYVFADASDLDKQTIIGVMSEAQQCSSSDMYAEPITYDSLLRLGVSQNEDIIQTPDWGLIFGLLISLLFGVPVFIFFLALVNSRAWSIHEARKAKYRLLNECEDLEYWKQEGTIWDKSNLKVQVGERRQLEMELPGIDMQELDMLIDSDDEPIVKPSVEQKKLMQTRQKENLEGLHETNPKVFQDIYSELQEHSIFIKNDFMQREGIDEENINRMFLETDLIKRAMRENLKNMGRRAKVELIFKDEEEEEDEEGKSEKSEDEDEDGDEPPKREFDDKVDNALDNADEGDDARMKKQLEVLDEGKKVMINELRDKEEEREKYKAQLDKTNLSEKEKKELLKEFDANFKHIQQMMLVEEEKQEANLNRKLEERKARRAKLSEKVEELQDEKEETKDHYTAELRQVRKIREAEEKKIEEDAEKDSERELARLDNDQANELEMIKNNFTAKLAKEKDPDKVSSMLKKYNADIGKLEANLSKDGEKQRKDLLMRLEVRKQKRLKEAKDKHKDEEKKLKDERDQIVGEIDKKIELIVSNINNTELDAQVQKVVENEDTANLEEEKERALKQVEAETEARKEQLERERLAELAELKAQNRREKEEEEKRQAEELRASEEEMHRAESELHAQKKELEDQLRNCTSDSERRRLLLEIADFEKNMAKKLMAEKDKQALALQEKLKKRKKNRENRRTAIEDKFEQKIVVVDEQKKEEYKRATMHHNKEKLERLIANLKLCIFPHELPFAIEKLIDESQMGEVTDLLNEHFREKAEKLRKSLGKLFKDKSLAMNAVHNDIEETRIRLKEQLNSSQMDQDEYRLRMEGLKGKEQDRLNDIELDFTQKQTEVEEEIGKSLDKKQGDELVNMKAEQYESKNELLKRYITDDLLQNILLGDEEEQKHEVDLYNEQLEAENEARAKEIEDKKQKLMDIVEDNEDQLRELDLQAKKLMEAQSLRDKKRDEKFKKENQERLEAIKLEMEKKGSTEKEKKAMMEEHMKEWDEMTKTMDRERDRQGQVLKQKLETKLRQKEVLKLEKEQKLKAMKAKTREAVDLSLTNMALGILRGDMGVLEQFKANKDKGPEKTPAEQREEKIVALDKHNTESRIIIEKIKPLMGIEVAEKTQQGFLGLLSKKAVKVLDKRDPYSFDLLLDKIMSIEETVGEFSGPQFKQLISEFKQVMKQVKKLNKKNKGMGA